MNIVDNFLSQEEFDSIRKAIDGNHFPWFLGTYVAGPEDKSDFYFVHTFYIDFKPNSSFISVVNPILEKINSKALIRARANLYVGRNKLIEHAKHVDFDYPHKAMILYLNTNDGFTRLHDGQCVNSIANRALFFDGSLEHNSTNCTNAQTRQVITISYF